MRKILILVFIIFAFVSSAFANFADEYAIKKKDGKYGLLSKTTQTLILPYEYDKIEYAKTNRYVGIVVKNGKVGAFDYRSKNIIIEPEYEDIEPFLFNAKFVQAKKNGKWGIVSKDKKILVPFKYDDISLYSVLIVKKDNKFGVLDDSFTEILPTKYDEIEEYNNCLRVKNNNKYGLYDYEKQKKFLLPIKYDEISRLGYYLKLGINNKYGVFDSSTGTFITPIKYDEVEYLDLYTSTVKLNNKYGIVVSKNNFLEPIYDEISCIHKYHGSDYKVKIGKKYGLLRYKTLEQILPVEYEDIQNSDDFSERPNNVVVKCNDKWGLIDKVDKKMILPCQFNSIKYTKGIQNKAVIYKAKNGKILNQYYSPEGKRISKLGNATKTGFIIVSKTAVTPVALVGDVLLNMTILAPVFIWASGEPCPLVHNTYALWVYGF